MSTPKRHRTHRTTVTETRAGFVWTCSCGDYSLVPGEQRIASAGAKRHRRYMDELRAATPSRESHSCTNLGMGEF